MPSWLQTQLVVLLCAVSSIFQRPASAELVRVDLSHHDAWRLTNSNHSIDLPTKIPAHTISVLASAGLAPDDPLYRYGERDTRWVGEEQWNFTLVWNSKKHQALVGCRRVLLVLHGIDTFGLVVLNGRHLLQADNSHRSWWVPLSGPDALRAGANMLSIVLRPAADMAARAKAAYPYPVPTMQVPGGINVYNFARKPAFDFGWDWGPAFVPVGITGGVELVGFDRATLIGALVTQQFNSSSNAFDLTITAQLLVPAVGDNGTLSVTLAVLDVHKEQQVQLQPSGGLVGGNELQVLVTMQLQLPASKVKLWQPLTLQPKGEARQLYDLAVMFEPTPDPPSQVAGTCGVAGSNGAGPDIRSTIVRRIGFRTVELVQQPMQDAVQEVLLGQQDSTYEHDDSSQAGQAQAASAGPQSGESFYFKVNGVPLFAKGANLIPLHVLSTAVTAGDVWALLRSAVDANMNMIRIWGGGMYQVDELYEAADELGLMVWQEAMFACSPYPRNAAFLANVEAEVTQQLLRLGSHASLVVFGGNNEVEQSLEWYPETLGNVPMYTTDYSSLFVETIGRVVQQMLPSTAWVDSSPSKGAILIPDTPGLHQPASPAAHKAAASGGSGGGDDADSTQQAATADGFGAHPVMAKRWGNTNDPQYGDVHFYNYRDDCQDWRTYPHARFVSEYGWQSYPSWSTYAAATSEEDWQLTADMTEYRQRHPNGTVELLAQLQRRFKLPQSWLDLLPQDSNPNKHQQQQYGQMQDLEHQAAAGSQRPLHEASFAYRAWHGLMSCAAQMLAVLQARLGLAQVPASSSSISAAPAAARYAQGLTLGTVQDSEGQHTSSSSSSISQSTTDMQDFIYLTQLQQMLCYETALNHWRRLRSDANTLSMGVLYWQLNDVWAGASWSSVDYKGVWKPVHYGVARAFADVALNMQHDLEADTISAYVVNDLQQPVNLQLAVRLLSATDTATQCEPQLSSSSSKKRSDISSYAFAAAPLDHVKHHSVLHKTAPAGAAALVWSKSVDALLQKAGQGCSRTSCYVHITLAAGEGQPAQEATVWLAPFKDLSLQDPQLAIDSFTPAHRAAQNRDSSAEAGVASSSLSHHKSDGAVTFRVSSLAVAAYAVWEVQGGSLPGHFSDNAVTVHPCEPREVTFVPRNAHTGWRGQLQGAAAAAAAGSTGQSTQQGGSSHSGGGGSGGGSGAQSARSNTDTLPADAEGADGSSTRSRAGPDGANILSLLQEALNVSSLWEHQQFVQQPEQHEFDSVAAV